MANFLFNPKDSDEVAPQTAPRHDAYLFDQGPTRCLGAVGFHDPMVAYGPVRLPNVDAYTMTS